MNHRRIIAFAGGFIASLTLVCQASAQFSTPDLAGYGGGKAADGKEKNVSWSLSIFPLTSFEIGGEFTSSGGLIAADVDFKMRGFLRSIGVGGWYWQSDGEWLNSDQRYKWNQVHVSAGLSKDFGLVFARVTEDQPAADSYTDQALYITKNFVLRRGDDGTPNVGLLIGAGPYWPDKDSFTGDEDVTIAWYVNLSTQLSKNMTATASVWHVNVKGESIITDGNGPATESVEWKNTRFALGIGWRF